MISLPFSNDDFYFAAEFLVTFLKNESFVFEVGVNVAANTYEGHAGLAQQVQTIIEQRYF